VQATCQPVSVRNYMSDLSRPMTTMSRSRPSCEKPAETAMTFESRSNRLDTFPAETAMTSVSRSRILREKPRPAGSQAGQGGTRARPHARKSKDRARHSGELERPLHSRERQSTLGRLIGRLRALGPGLRRRSFFARKARQRALMRSSLLPLT
jgi:hypothetical protein